MEKNSDWSKTFSDLQSDVITRIWIKFMALSIQSPLLNLSFFDSIYLLLCNAKEAAVHSCSILP